MSAALLSALLVFSGSLGHTDAAPRFPLHCGVMTAARVVRLLCRVCKPFADGYSLPIFWLHSLARVSIRFELRSPPQPSQALNDASLRYISTSTTEPACDKCNWE